MPHHLIDFSPEVAEAIADQKPLVALESTIIAHGMPYPENRDTARKVEEIIRSEGAVPATMAIFDGRIKAGLDADDLERLATSPDIQKASRRDFPILLGKKQSAATTVAATMICADLAGIRIFATGGIGGVHREAQQTFDISADLQELARTNVAVVSAGAKSILDLNLTLEYLETMGVPVIGVGTDEFPAFYTRHSGLDVPSRIDHPAEIAASLFHKWDLGLDGGALIANPIPVEYSMDPAKIEAVIQTAIQSANRESISGKALTPYLLGKIKDLTEGNSLFSNIQLVYNNARLAAQISVAYKQLQHD
ncbi:MAG: pseudouridine-5'-phosphate glycosidase [Bacteroidota bacterium]